MVATVRFDGLRGFRTLINDAGIHVGHVCVKNFKPPRSEYGKRLSGEFLFGLYSVEFRIKELLLELEVVRTAWMAL